MPKQAIPSVSQPAGTGETTPWRMLALLGLATLLCVAVFWRPLVELERIWSESPEYSHGYLLPVVCAYLVWHQRASLAAAPGGGSWWGVMVTGLGAALFLLGQLSTLYVLEQYAFVLTLTSVFLALLGPHATARLWVPLALLAMMIPLPQFLYQTLSGHLQLVSSELGVAVIRAAGISVHLAGNVIDLGGYRLQVVEACNGLRYLFPGLSFGLLMAYLFHAPLWQRVLLFVSTVPVVVLMNSLRIGVIGVLVEHFGVAMAEGFLHDFEGWVVFMACIGVLFVEMWALARLSGRRRLRTYFGLPPTAAVAPGPRRRFPLAFAGAGALLLGLAASSHALGTRTELAPPLTPLASFPLHSGAWSGEMSRLEDIYLSALDLTDYLLGNYRRADGGAVNLYVAYYRSQRSGHSAHSPRACIPGGGWEIRQVTRIPLPGLTMARQPLRVNRVEIQAGDARQLVYYWFQQRGRVITSEYMVKWYLFRDALIRRRTDGALVRATTALAPGEPWAAADARLTDFLAAVQSPLDRYLPD